MALVYDGMCCAICGMKIDIQESCFATWGVFLPPEHPLMPLCDAPLHWSCYERLPRREEFERAYLEMWIADADDNPYWGKAFASPDALLTVNRDLARVNVRLRQACAEIRVALADWDAWIGGAEVIEGVTHPLEQQAVRALLPILRESLTTPQALLDAVDWEALEQARERSRQRTRAEMAECLRKPRLHNKACRALLRDGAACPFCGNRSPEYLDRSPQAKSEFLCRCCEKTFGPVDVAVASLYGGYLAVR